MKANLRTTAGAAALTVVAGLSVAACTPSTPSGQQAESKAQQQDTTALVNNQPIPHFTYSQIRQTLIDAETISADGTQTTSFFFQMGDQDPVFSCPSLGMPVANTAQLSNPQQLVQGDNASVAISQMDPNGIYAPSSSTGTFVICVNSSGAKYLQYWEGDVMTVTSAATWDKTTHTLTVSGAPTAVIHTAPAKK
jgi:hypothetical protein